MVQCKKYSESTAGNGTQQKTVIFTADIFTVHDMNLFSQKILRVLEKKISPLGIHKMSLDADYSADTSLADTRQFQ